MSLVKRRWLHLLVCVFVVLSCLGCGLFYDRQQRDDYCAVVYRFEPPHVWEKPKDGNKCEPGMRAYGKDDVCVSAVLVEWLSCFNSRVVAVEVEHVNAVTVRAEDSINEVKERTIRRYVDAFGWKSADVEALMAQCNYISGADDPREKEYGYCLEDCSALEHYVRTQVVKMYIEKKRCVEVGQKACEQTCQCDYNHSESHCEKICDPDFVTHKGRTNRFHFWEACQAKNRSNLEQAKIAGQECRQKCLVRKGESQL